MLKKLLFIIILSSFLFSIFSCKPPVVAGSKKTQKIVPQCLPSQSQCLVETSIGSFNVTFSINADHNKVITEVPFHIIVKFKPLQSTTTHLKKVEGYLEGRDMFMGKIPAFFSESFIEEEKVHIAEILLGSCSEDIMTWRLWLTVELGENSKLNSNQIKTFFIDFDSHKYL